MDTAWFSKALPGYLLIATLTIGVLLVVGEFLLMAALSTGVLMVIGPLLPEPLFAEPLGSVHI